MAIPPKPRMSPAGRQQAESDSLNAVKAKAQRDAIINAKALAARNAYFNQQAEERSKGQGKKKKKGLFNPFDYLIKALGGE